MFYNMGKSENWTVPSGHGIIFGWKNMSPCYAVAFAWVVKYCVRMRTKNYIAGAIENTIGGVCGTVTE